MLLSNWIISDQFRKPAVFAQFNVFFKISLNLLKAAAVEFSELHLLVESIAIELYKWKAYVCVSSKHCLSILIKLLWAANTHLHQLDDLQSWIELTCSFNFQPLSHRRIAAIMRLNCCLLTGEGHGNLQTYCPRFHDAQICCRSLVFTPGIQLIIYVLLIPVYFKTLDRFKCSWLATATDIWNGLPADMLLQGETYYGWYTILRDIQHFLCTWHYMVMGFITIKKLLNQKVKTIISCMECG